MANSESYYDILKVTPTAQPEVIEAAYRAQRKILTTKKVDGDITELVTRVIEAHRILSDPNRKLQYDETRTRLMGKLVGNYRVVSALAEGDFGRIYKAEQIFLDQPACLKQPKNVSVEDDAQLTHEALVGSNLQYPSLLSVRDLIRLNDGSYIMATNFFPGETIEQYVKRLGRLDPESMCWVTERLLDGLLYMNAQGVIHAGISPSNLIVDDEKHTVGIVDYKLSVIDPLKNPGTRGFIPYFSPPEQILDPNNFKRDPLVAQSDLYGVGKTLIYAFNGGALDAVEKNQLPNFVPTPFRDFINRLTQPLVTDRPRWEDEDLFETLAKIREKSFGRRRSDFKPIGGVDNR